MATKTIYTSTISVPSYASWKCEKCGEINFSIGTVQCQEQKSTTSFRNSKLEATKEAASNLVQTNWKKHVVKFIFEPKENAQSLRKDFFLDNTNCTKCGAKPKWDKDMKYWTYTTLACFPTMVSGLIAFECKTSIIAWLIFVALASVVVWGIVSESSYKKMMKKLPKQYTPVIGTLNQELVEYANALGKKIPTPEETIAIVKAYKSDYRPYQKNANKQEKKKENLTVGEESNFTEYIFCRKCGNKLFNDSDFCHKCGKEVVRVVDNQKNKYEVCIFDSQNKTLRKETREIDIIKFPPLKYSNNDTYYAIEKIKDDKKVRIYYEKNNWDKQIENCLQINE